MDTNSLGAGVTRKLEPIEVDRIFLYEENPRHEPIDSEPEIIDHLCKDEQVFNLARSISDAGPNPLELLGVIELPGTRSKKSYQVWEGNRRICAIKLLNDPDLAPAHLRKDFTRLASQSVHVPIKKINAVIFDDHDDLKFWMGIIHNGFQAGVGRIDWDADQKARHFGTSNRNRVALAVLDAAEGMGLITKDERSGKLTTAQRFLHSSLVKEALGLDTANPADITVNRPKEDFQKQLGRFIADLKEGIKVTSRHNRDRIDDYGRKLARNPEISADRVQPQSLKTAAATAAVKASKQKSAPKKLRKKVHLEYDDNLAKALENYGNTKLETLYHSICNVRLEHTPLLTIGVWAFIESLTALAGKNSDVDFVAFFSKERLAGYGFQKQKSGPMKDALMRIQKNGNATKHHEVAASFDGKQLSNDLATISPLLTKTIESIGTKK